MPYKLTKRGIEKYIDVVTYYALREDTPKKDRDKLLEITEVLDELQIAGGVFKE